MKFSVAGFMHLSNIKVTRKYCPFLIILLFPCYQQILPSDLFALSCLQQKSNKAPMAYKGAAPSGGKRKLASGGKDSSSKKPKVEKRAPVKSESDDVSSDSSDASDFSDQDDGGAVLENERSHDNSDGLRKNRSNGDEPGKVFEKGWFVAIAPRDSH